VADDKEPDDKPALPEEQTCRKCGALFRWEPEHPDMEGSNLIAKLVTGSDKCDCGYGSLDRPPPRTIQ